MRQYERNGVILGVIDGGGEGDGIPAGQLRLAAENEILEVSAPAQVETEKEKETFLQFLAKVFSA